MMDEISIVISFAEMISILLIYNILINDKLFYKIMIKFLAAITTSVIYAGAISYYGADQLISLVGVIFINAILVSKLEDKDTILTFIELIVSLIVVSVLELIATFGIHLIIGEQEPSTIIYGVLLTIIMLSLVFLLSYTSIGKKLRLGEFFSRYKSINIIILNLFVFFLLIKLLATNDLMKTNIVIQITILGLILIGINCYFYLYLYRTLSEKKKTEIKKSFNPLINDLMGKVKANEHEYKNHLNTIWSIAQISSPEEVKSKIKEYMSSIVDDSEEFSMLVDVENTIVKAVLYNKGQRAEKLDVKYNYRVNSNLKDISLDNSELTVVLSNLLNNAIEATSIIDKKEIEVDISEDNKSYIINVRNYTEGLKAESLSNIFKMGYSTKGEGRGYGLYNVKQIVEKHKGKIQISLDDDIINIRAIFMK